MSIINDLVTEVLYRSGNKTTDTARAVIWLRDALIEITSNPGFRNEFDQLEVYGVKYNLIARQQEYAFSTIVSSGDYNLATLDLLIWLDPPTNTIRRQLAPSHYQKADNFVPSYSLPTEWYRFGDNYGLTPIPDKTYQVQPRLLRAHPISATVSQTTILLPSDWNEILIWAAVERAFMEYLEFEKAVQIRTLLYGDPKHPERPGLTEGRKKRRELEAHRVSEPLRVAIRPIGRK